MKVFKRNLLSPVVGDNKSTNYRQLLFYLCYCVTSHLQETKFANSFAPSARIEKINVYYLNDVRATISD